MDGGELYMDTGRQKRKQEDMARNMRSTWNISLSLVQEMSHSEPGACLPDTDTVGWHDTLDGLCMPCVGVLADMYRARKWANDIDH